MKEEQLKRIYFEHVNLLKDYLGIVASNPEISDAEMHTQQGYLKQQVGRNGYPPTKYVFKLKEFFTVS